jgi:regulatory protein
MRRPPPRADRGDSGSSPQVSLKVKAVRLLARREYARAELAQHLIKRGAEPDDVEHVLDELSQSGYLSDARYAQVVVTQKAGRYAKRAIAYELKSKGVSLPEAEEALASLAQTDETADALALWRRRFGTPPANDREKSRQLRFLLSRGYSTSLAFKVLKIAGGITPADSDLPDDA